MLMPVNAEHKPNMLSMIVSIAMASILAISLLPIVDSSVNIDSDNFAANAMSYANSPIEEGVYYIAAHGRNDYALDVPYAQWDSRAQMQLHQSNRSQAQTFYLKCLDGKNLYAIMSLCNYESMLCINARGATLSNGSDIWTYYYDNSLSSKWYIDRNANGSYTFVSARDTKYALAIAGPKYENGTKVLMWQRYQSIGSDSASQQFDLQRASSGYMDMPVTTSWWKTQSPLIFNRLWVSASSNGTYFEQIGSDPVGPRPNMDSWQGVQVTHIQSYAFATWSSAGGQDDLTWYSGSPGSWSRGGAEIGHGGMSWSANGTGTGCISTYGYGWGGNVLQRHGGFNSTINSHVYLTNTAWGGETYKYGEVTWYPRIKVSYDANGGWGAPGAHYKRAGELANASTSIPARTGYMFVGWSGYRNGAVAIAPGQRIGYEDWNMAETPYIPHDFNDGPSEWFSDTTIGIKSPSGSNNITLYAKWSPIPYKVVYDGNGATSGSTPKSNHKYDASQPLSNNGFDRVYDGQFKSQGGSKGNFTENCRWRFAGWNQRANGSGTSYYNGQNVTNLTNIKDGTVKLYAQWNQGYMTLPTPGTRPNYEFQGWYDSPTGGKRIGGQGDAVALSKDTVFYAQWRPLTTVKYFADGDAKPIWQDVVYSDTKYSVNQRATNAGLKPGCESFDCWYTDKTYNAKFVDSSIVTGTEVRLYGRNEVTLEYDTTDKSTVLDGELSDLYIDEEKKYEFVDAKAIYPPKKSYWYGDTVRFDLRNAKLYYTDQRIDRVLKPADGVFLNVDGSGQKLSSLKLLANAIVYVDWPWPVYDGVLDQRS